MLDINLQWLTPDIEPKVDGLISRTVLFTIDSKVYIGHYHCNGFFYCDEINHKAVMAVLNEAVYKLYPYAKETPKIGAWAYLREA